ncbi:MAG: radical SAM protein [bacterium]
MPLNHPLFRPPAEADSLILQVDQGCPYNRCTFCGMYRRLPYQRRTLPEIQRMIAAAARQAPETRRVFLADGDVMRRPFSELRTLLLLLNEHFPRLARVNLYATGSAIQSKTDDELQALRESRLHTLYLGLESGDETTLQAVRKGETAAGMIAAGIRAQAVGLRVSVMILLGLGGQTRSRDHALATASALNAMQPRLLSALRVVPIPGTELQADIAAGRFLPLTEHQTIEELRLTVQALELTNTVFRANHSSNVIPLEARLPRDKEQLLDQLKRLLASGQLDDESPCAPPLWM